MAFARQNWLIFPSTDRMFLIRTAPLFRRKNRVRNSCHNPSGRLSSRRHFRSVFTPRFRCYTYQPVSGRSGWPSRDPIVESSFRLSYSALLPPQEQLAFLHRLPDGNEYIFVGNRPVYSVDSLGLTKWRGTCYAYGVSVTLGYLFVQCYLESDCSIGADKHSEWVAVKAAMFQAGVWLATIKIFQ